MMARLLASKCSQTVESVADVSNCHTCTSVDVVYMASSDCEGSYNCAGLWKPSDKLHQWKYLDEESICHMCNRRKRTWMMAIDVQVWQLPMCMSVTNVYVSNGLIHPPNCHMHRFIRSQEFKHVIEFEILVVCSLKQNSLVFMLCDQSNFVTIKLISSKLNYIK